MTDPAAPPPVEVEVIRQNQQDRQLGADVAFRLYGSDTAAAGRLLALLNEAEQDVTALLGEVQRLIKDRNLEKRWRKDSDERAALLEEEVARLQQERDWLREELSERSKAAESDQRQAEQAEAALERVRAYAASLQRLDIAWDGDQQARIRGIGEHLAALAGADAGPGAQA